MAAAEVAALAETMGHLLDLPAWQLKLRLAGCSTHCSNVGECPVWGTSCPWYRQQVLRTMPRMRAIAKSLTTN